MESEGDSGVKYDVCYDDDGDFTIGESDDKLSRTLSRAKPGSGHDCFLKAITVHFEVEAPHYWWNQAQRYHFWDIASSTSKMHSIHKGDIDDKCSKWVRTQTKKYVNLLIWWYNNWDDYPRDNFQFEVSPTPSTKDELFECILDNTPLGYQLKAGWVTNYLQLKSVWNQRKNHKLSHWNKDFVEWVKSLPMSHLITLEEE
jgi:hypothetical protein